MTTSTSGGATMTVVEWKPEGRGRKFRRDARGLARRMRIPFVRRVLWERDHPEALGARQTGTYGAPWTSTNALVNWSFACTCHRRERYSRKSRKGRKS